MIKLLTRSSCTLCRTMVLQISSVNIRKHSIVAPNIEECKQNLLRKQRNDFKKKQNTRHDKVYIKQKSKQIEAVKAVLQKHNINLEESVKYEKMFYELPWTIEKRIMFLKELGATRIDPYHIGKFIQRTQLPTKLIKAACSIESEVDLTKNLFSQVKDPNFDHEIITSIHEDLPLREFFVKILVCYLKQKFNANEDELSCINVRKGLVFLYNSFSLMEETLKFLMNELNYDKTLILKNRSLLGLHPDQGKLVLQMLKEYFGDLTPNILKKYPKIIEYDVYDLEIFLSYLKEIQVEPSDAVANYAIFHLCSAEFKRRQNSLLNNPFTVVYKKHPRFLSLIKDYYIILPRIRYLQEKNLKFATIHSLTTFHNPFDQLTSVKRLTKTNLKFFLKSQYGEDAELLTERIQKHPFHQYAPLMQMHETLNYLKTHYSQQVIYKHVYAILYHKEDLIAARKNIMSNPQYCQWPSERILAMCVYEIEEKSHFTGEAVLTPLKYAEGCAEESVPERSTEDGTKNN